jgi:ribose transport system substrate-binding protein
MKWNAKDALPLGVILVCALICTAVTLLRTRHTVEPIAWYGPMPHPYITEVAAGVDAAQKDLSVPIYKMVGQEWTQDNESVNVEALATTGHQGFCIYPVDASGANGLFAELTARGQFVVAYGAEPALPTPASFTVATDIQGAAETACEELIRLMGDHGNILNVLESVTDINTQKRDAGVRAAVARHPRVKIIQTIGDMSQVSEATTKIQSALAARAGEIDGIIATGYNPTIAIVAILNEWNKDSTKKRIHFIGMDTGASVLAAIREGSIDATIAQNTFGHGYIPAAIIDLMVKGWKPTKPYQFINSGIVVVEKSNIDSYAGLIRKLTDGILGDLKTKYLIAPSTSTSEK